MRWSPNGPSTLAPGMKSGRWPLNWQRFGTPRIAAVLTVSGHGMSRSSSIWTSNWCDVANRISCVANMTMTHGLFSLSCFKLSSGWYSCSYAWSSYSAHAKLVLSTSHPLQYPHTDFLIFQELIDVIHALIYTHVYSCIFLYTHSCILMYMHVYSFKLICNSVYSCLYSCILMRTPVYSCILMRTSVYSCILVRTHFLLTLTHICSCIITYTSIYSHLHLRIIMITCVYPCIVCS